MKKLDIISKASGATENRRPTWRLVLAFLILISVTFVPAMALFRYGQTLQSQNYSDLAAGPQECGIVLTGGQGRIREGLVILSRKLIKRLIISGVHPKATLIEIFPDLVFYPDINLEEVILERRSGTTASNALHSLMISEALQCKKILLITSDYHMYRALRTFKSVFPATTSIVPYTVATDVFKPTSSWYSSVRGWGIVSEEAFKFFFYQLTVF